MRKVNISLYCIKKTTKCAHDLALSLPYSRIPGFAGRILLVLTCFVAYRVGYPRFLFMFRW